MATIPSNTQFRGDTSGITIVEKGSSQTNNRAGIFTMQDFIDTIGTVPADTDENSWIFTQGKWRKMHKNNSGTLKRYKEKYNLLAIELTLTN